MYLIIFINYYHTNLFQEPILRATQCIMSIVQLQQQLHHMCNKRLDRSEATQMTIGDFVKSLGTGKNPN